MDRKYHFLSGVIVSLILLYAVEKITVSQIWLPMLLGAIAADVDMLIDKGMHRNFLFHSILFPSLVLVFNFDLEHLLWIFLWSIHLIMDITITPSRWIGFYQIKFYHGCIWFPERGKGVFSTLWLLINAIAGFAISIICFLLFIM